MSQLGIFILKKINDDLSFCISGEEDHFNFEWTNLHLKDKLLLYEEMEKVEFWVVKK